MVCKAARTEAELAAEKGDHPGGLAVRREDPLEDRGVERECHPGELGAGRGDWSGPCGLRTGKSLGLTALLHH